MSHQVQRTNSLATFIGLMSGTSLDAVDLVLVDFAQFPPKLINTYSKKIPTNLKETVLNLNLINHINLTELGQLDTALGIFFAECINDFLLKINYQKHLIQAIGSHGQTIAHNPNLINPFTMQIGDPNIIVNRTQITTVSDFRRADIANGGQGAPLVPLFHHYLFASKTCDRVLLNLGGIANITFLPKNTNAPAKGFDTGPANTLIDAWIKHISHKEFDQNGEFAQTGNINQTLLNIFISDPYFKQNSPKSTGKDYFNLNWILNNLQKYRTNILHQTLTNADIQATLTMLTAISTTSEINKLMQHGELILCGGGTFNNTLRKFIVQNLPSTIKLLSTNDLGIDPQWIEAMCFAWLAMQRINHVALDYTKITGSSRPTILGAIYTSIANTN